MLYREGAPTYRRYDTCYYDILAGDDINHLKSTLGLRIYLKIINKRNLNVYVYGGRDRFNAVTSITHANEPAQLATNYTTRLNDGYLVVAYPKEGVETELEIEYWVADLSGDIVERLEELNFEGKDGQMLLGAICLAVILFLLFICCCAYCICRCASGADTTKVDIMDVNKVLEL